MIVIFTFSCKQQVDDYLKYFNKYYTKFDFLKKTRYRLESENITFMFTTNNPISLRGIRPDYIFCDQELESEEIAVMRCYGSIVQIMKKLSY